MSIQITKDSITLRRGTLVAVIAGVVVMAALPGLVDGTLRDWNREPVPDTPTVAWMVEHPGVRTRTIEYCIRDPKRMQDYAAWCDTANRAAEVINNLKQ